MRPIPMRTTTKHPRTARLLIISTLIALTACGADESADDTRAPAASETAEAAPGSAAMASAATDSVAANGCPRTDTLPASDRVIRHPPTVLARFSCELRAGEPPLAVVLEPGPDGYRRWLRVFAAADSTRPLQVLDLGKPDGPVPDGEPHLEALDLDADGWRDLRLLAWAGAANVGYHTWLYDPARRRFARSEELSALTSPEPIPGRPCVRTNDRGGHAGMIYTSSEHCREGGRWVEVRREAQDDLADGVYLKTTYERRGDSLVVVRRDTVRAPVR